MAAYTIKVVQRFRPLHGMRRGLVDITFDATYIAGGWPVTPADLGLTILAHILLPAGLNETGLMLTWDYGATPWAGGKICAVAGVGGAALTNQADGLVVRGEYVGM